MDGRHIAGCSAGVAGLHATRAGGPRNVNAGSHQVSGQSNLAAATVRRRTWKRLSKGSDHRAGLRSLRGDRPRRLRQVRSLCQPPSGGRRRGDAGHVLGWPVQDCCSSSRSSAYGRRGWPGRARRARSRRRGRQRTSGSRPRRRCSRARPRAVRGGGEGNADKAVDDARPAQVRRNE